MLKLSDENRFDGDWLTAVLEYLDLGFGNNQNVELTTSM